MHVLEWLNDWAGIRKHLASTVSWKCKIIPILIIYTSVPSASPTSVTTSSVTSSTITVQWGPVDCIQRNGDITGYSVRYGIQGSGSTQTVSVSGGGATRRTVSGFDSSTTYTIEVAAVNSAGSGPFSSPITRKTNGIWLHKIYLQLF